jgi:cyclopropane-fatty-acyl-phospholipid synthase
MSRNATPTPYRLPNPWHAVIAAVLRGIRTGEIAITMPQGQEHRYAGKEPGPKARITVNDSSIARRILTGGDIALAEGYMDGLWDTDDLDAVLDLGLANLSAGWVADIPFALRPFHRAWHRMRDNDPWGGSKRNAAYHYDLGNDFYSLWLDNTMTYSSALLGEGNAPLTDEQLESGQRRKWDRILDLIQPGARDHILEIGCGWGGFAIHAAKEAGCHVTGLTLSEEQADLARSRVLEEGLEGRIDIRLQDYRETPETYSGIASIEMFEAVGEKWWPTYFDRVKGLLEPGGAAALQVITIAEERFEDYKREPDFIQRYIFPGGMLPSPERFRFAAEAARLSMSEPLFFGKDYARTLIAWAQRYEAVLPEIRALGFDEHFVRMWRYYLAYCRAGFETGNVDVMQVRLEA